MKKEIYKTVSCSIVAISLIAIIIYEFVNDSSNGYDGWGYNYEVNEEFLYFLYATVVLLIGSIVKIVRTKKNLEVNKIIDKTSLFLCFAFLLGYFSKVFFKALNNGDGFSELNFIFTITTLLLTVYFFIDVFKYFVEKNK